MVDVKRLKRRKIRGIFDFMFCTPRDMLINGVMKSSLDFINRFSFKSDDIIAVGNLPMEKLVLLIKGKMTNISLIFHHKVSF